MKLFEQLTWRVQKKLTQWQERTDKEFSFSEIEISLSDIAGRMLEIFSDNESFEFSMTSANWHKFLTHHHHNQCWKMDN